MAARGTGLAAEQDHREMEPAPGVPGKQCLQIPLGLLDAAAVRESPARRQPMNVGIDGKRRLSEGLGEHDARGLVTDAGQRLERQEIRGHLAGVFADQDLRERADVLRLRRREPARADLRQDRLDGKLRHRRRRPRQREQTRRHLVHTLVRRLGGEQDRDEQRKGVLVDERDRRRGMMPPQDLDDALRLLGPDHPRLSVRPDPCAPAGGADYQTAIETAPGPTTLCRAARFDPRRVDRGFASCTARARRATGPLLRSSMPSGNRLPSALYTRIRNATRKRSPLARRGSVEGLRSFGAVGHPAIAGATHVGVVRRINQDAFGRFDDPARGEILLAVADGLGGHRGGEVASRMAIELLGPTVASGAEPAPIRLTRAIEEANRRIHEEARVDYTLEGMGTTVVCLLVGQGGECHVAHVGDSRLYRLRDGRVEPLTEDHSLVATLVREGVIRPEEARTDPRRNQILRALGVRKDVEIDVAPVEILPGDAFLLCSDGLHGLIEDFEIRDLTLEHPEVEVAVERLIEAANRAGGTDNVTCMLARFPEAPPLPAWRAGAQRWLATMRACLPARRPS